MLLFRFIAESSVFSSDFIRECKTAIEIGAPFEEMCETFLLFSTEKRTVALIPIIVLWISLPQTKEHRIWKACIKLSCVAYADFILLVAW